jgi:hypothetical protein
MELLEVCLQLPHQLVVEHLLLLRRGARSKGKNANVRVRSHRGLRIMGGGTKQTGGTLRAVYIS